MAYCPVCGVRLGGSTLRPNRFDCPACEVELEKLHFNGLGNVISPLVEILLPLFPKLLPTADRYAPAFRPTARRFSDEFPEAHLGQTMEVKIYNIDCPSGRLAIMPRPRGDHLLDSDIGSLRAQGVDLVISLLDGSEIVELGLLREGLYCRSHGIEFLHFPMGDRGLPADNTAFAELCIGLQEALTSKKSIAIHCRMGIGRASTLAACVLVEGGLDAKEALRRVQKARGIPVPDTEAQRQFILEFRANQAATAIEDP